MDPSIEGGTPPAAAARSRPDAAGVKEGSAPRGAQDARLARAPGEPLSFLLGDWIVDVPTRRLRRDDETVTLEPRPMAVLAALCRHPGEVVSAESLLQDCWPEATTLGDNPVHKVVAGLRRALGDSATTPRYLETIRKQGYRLVAAIGVLSAEGPRSHAGGWRGLSPFRGLEPFDAAHASVFFGRDDAVAALHLRMTRQWRLGHPLMVLLGPSGSGKTSLVQAGLVPALMRPAPDSDPGAPLLRVSAAALVDLGALGGLDAWAGVAGAMLDWECQGVPLLSGYSIDTLAADLREAPGEVLRQLAIGLDTTRALRAGAQAPPLLVLDRLEALFQGDDGDLGAWFAMLDRLVSSARLAVLAICRNDFYAALARWPALMRGKEEGAHLDLAPPDARAIAQMIRLPARAAGLSYGADESGLNRLDDRLCIDAMQASDALPLLQYTLQQLYLNRAPGDVLAWSAYEDLGGLEGAIGRRAEALLGELPPAQQEALPRLLPRLVALGGEEASPTSRWLAASELTDAQEQALVRAFVDARLLVADRVGGMNAGADADVDGGLNGSGGGSGGGGIRSRVGGVSGYRVAHEALLRRWPRVTAWVAQHRASLAARDELRPWVARWIEADQAGPLLMPRGSTLWTAARALAEAPQLFDAQERDFIERSQRRLRRQRWGLGAASAGAFLLAGVAGIAAIGYARQAEVAAERQRQSRQLASFMLGELADKLRPMGQLDVLSRIGEQGLKLLAPAEGGRETPGDALQRARALVVIGEVNSSRGQGRTDIATDALHAALQLLLPLDRAAQQDPAAYYKTLGAASFWLGQMAFDAGDLETASQEMARYRDASEAWRQVLPEDGGAQAELGFAVNSLGSIAYRRAAWDEAQRWFEQALALKLAALARKPDDADAKEAVASSRMWLGRVAQIRGNPVQALALFDVARQPLAELAARTPDALVRQRDLAAVEQRRADAMRASGRLRDAVDTMGVSVALLQEAERREPGNRFWSVDRQHAQANLLLLRDDAGMDVRDALDALRAEVQTRPESEPGREFLRRTVLARLAVAEATIAARRGRPADFDRWRATAEAAIQTLLASSPRDWQSLELAARLGLLSLAMSAGPTPPASASTMQSAASRPADAQAVHAGPRAMCESLRDTLGPAVAAGQAGLALEAWLAARRCLRQDAGDDADLARLRAGGYAPGLLEFSSTLPTKRKSPS
ncbi:winged helix-turn-helix domain-containing protein [Roseateles chitinivorans]|uniref:nSTAND1 domain-containing NTPase n=1 Tax=Roseateles chitinivorans TaxID=2917965 RepID=UPI003D673C1D